MPTLFAYIDPFTGSLLLQLLVAGFMALVLFFKRAKAFTLELLGFQQNKATDMESADIPTIKLEQTKQPNKEEKKAA